MPTFIYKAKKKDTGEEYEGELEAKDRFAVYTHIKQEEGTVLSVSEKGAATEIKNIKNIQITIGGVKEGEKVNLARNLSAMLSAGLSLTRALSVVERQARNQRLKDVAHELSEDVSGGGTFADALEKFPKEFSSLFVSMVRAGEEGGKLPEALRTISDQMEKTLLLKKKIQGALIYPAIIVIALIGIGFLMLTYVVPTLKNTFEDLGIELPATTQFILALSDFLVEHTLVALAIIIAIVTLATLFLKSKRGKRTFDFVLLHTPIIGTLAKEINSARTARTLSSLLTSGVSVVKAISITKEVVQNSYYQDVLEETAGRVQKGTSIHEVFQENEKLYPPLVSELVSVGEETGKLPDMLIEVANFYESEVDQKTKNMSTIVEPFLMVVVGVAVGFFVIAMISPLYSITDGI